MSYRIVTSLEYCIVQDLPPAPRKSPGPGLKVGNSFRGIDIPSIILPKPAPEVTQVCT